jgi:hypothetical protein
MREYITKLAQGFETPGATRLGIHVRIGSPVQGILQMATDAQADLLIVGTHSRDGVKRLVLGSVAEEVVRNAHCPVLVARATDYQGLHLSDQVEAPCPDCLETRRQTSGEQWWCSRHRAARPQTHVFSDVTPVHWTRGAPDVYGSGMASTQW